MTQSNPSQISQIMRRVQLDPDIPQQAKDVTYLVTGILKKMMDDYYRNLLFPPAIGYDDLFQELLHKLVTTAVDSYNTDWGVPFAGFAHGVLLNHFRYMIRFYGKHAKANIPLDSIMETDAEAFAPESEALSEFYSTELAYQFALHLTDRQRQVFKYRYEDEKITASEIAELIGCSLPTINREIRDIRVAYIAYAIDEHLPLPGGYVFSL